MIRKLMAVLLLLACALGLFSCKADTDFSGSGSLSEEEMRTLLASMQGETTGTDGQEKLYYFVSGSGTVYHSNAACSYLKNSKNVIEGTLSEALAAGKETLCSACAAEEQKQDSAPPDTEENARICYYTAGGSVWHYDSACATLSHSENVQTGTVAQAMLEGKTRACARCGD